jgi:hypothetical protein
MRRRSLRSNRKKVRQKNLGQKNGGETGFMFLPSIFLP